MNGAAIVSPEVPPKTLDQKFTNHDKDYYDDENDDLEYSLTTDEGSLKNENDNNDDNAPKNKEKNERRRFLPIRKKSSLKTPNGRNKEKAMCEYFNEEAHLDEGDLPSLHRPGTTPPPMNGSGNGKNNGHGHHRIVSPLPSRTSTRDSTLTPVQDNTEVTLKKKKSKDKEDVINKKKNSKKNRSMDGSGHSYNNGNSNDVVTLKTPRLTTEDKRKHRAFWDQFDAKRSDESENGSQTDASDLAPKDELMRSSNSKYTARKKEVLQGEDDDEDDKGIISMVVDMCSDCGWIVGDDNNISNHQKPKRRQSTSRTGIEKDREINSLVTDDEDTEASRSRMRREDDSIALTRELSVISRGSRGSRGDTSHRIESDDDSFKDSGAGSDSVRRKRGYLTRENSEQSSSPHQSGSNHQFGRRNVSEPQNYENTKIEVEYEEGDPRFLQLNQNGDVSLYARPGERNQVRSNNAQDVPSLNREPVPSDEQRYQPDANIESPLANERGYLMSKSTSWSDPQKGAYLQAMAQKAKQDFNKRKGVVAEKPLSVNAVPRTPERNKMRINDDEDSLTGILGKNEGKEQAPKSSKAIDWTRHNWTPSEKRRLFHLVKSEGMSPEEATEIVTASRSKRRSGYTEDSKSGGSQNSTPNYKRDSAFQPESSQNVKGPNGQHPIHGVPSSPPTSKVDVVEDNVISPLKSVGSPGSITARSKKAGATILSNLRKRPGFSRVVGTDTEAQSIEESCEESVEISLAQSLDKSLPTADLQSSSKSVTKSLKKKKALKSGRVWHEINDNDDEYSGGKNEVRASQNNRSFKDDSRNDDIFDFQTSDGADDKVPLDTLKLDPYNDSCDVSLLGSMMTGDHTVMSGNRSVYTTATNASTWSTSTRRRHRGAARNRKAEEKNDQKPVGWLDSIRAVAQSNNREWDPQVGWVGYADPTEKIEEVDGKQEVVRIGVLKAPKVSKTIKDLRREAELSAQTNNSIEEDAISVPFPSQWEKERDDMVSVYKDDDGTSSEVTEVIKNSMSDNDNFDVVSHAETEVVSNQVTKMSRNVYRNIPERIAEDSYYSDEEGEEDEEDDSASSQNEIEIVHERLEEADEGRDYDAEKKEGHESTLNNIMSLQTEAIRNLKEMIFSSDAEEVVNQRNIPKPIIKEDEHEIELESDSSPQSNHSASYKSIGPHSTGSISRKSDSNDLMNEKEKGFEKKAGSDTAESSSDDEDAEDFDNGMTSFDFSEVGKMESTENSGFKIIESTLSSPVFKLTDIAFIDDDDDDDDEDKSVTSTSSMMSQKAKQWREKVDIKKRSLPPQQEEVLVEETNHDHGNIFVSAADDNSTIEYRERPKILNVDEEDTLFDFGATHEETTAKPMEKKVQGPKNLERNISSERNRSSNPPNVERNISSERNRSSNLPNLERNISSERNRSSNLPNLGRNHSLYRRKSRGSIDDSMSEITTPTVDMNKPDDTFLKRLHSCTVDAVDRCDQRRNGTTGLPKAHLQFLRNSSTADVGGASKSKDNQDGGLISMLTSPGLCGRSESIEDSEYKKTRGNSKRTNLASSYLEAINACKYDTEVRKTPSILSSSSVQSETWQRFLDKRAIALSSKRSNTDVSKAAQEYASKKVGEIVERVNNEEISKRQSAVVPSTRPPSSNRSKSHIRRRQDRQASDKMMSKSDAAKAAEDLAAARVEAMMAMEPRTLNQDESEI